jgi:hypothetical protein
VVPRAVAGAGGAIPARPPWPGGSGRGVVLGLPRLDFDRRLGRWWRRQSRAVAAAAASHGTACSGEPPAGARERAVWSTPAGARGGIGTVARPWGLVGARLRPAAACTHEGGCGGVARCRGAWRECPAH